MASPQSSAVQSTFPFTLDGNPYVLTNETIKQDASRTAALAQYTIMAYVSATQKWVPWSNLTASDGSAYPMGILMTDGGFTGAQVAAGDVTGAAIAAGGTAWRVDGSQVVFDTGVGGGNTALALTSQLNSNAVGSGSATVYFLTTAQRWLESRGIFIQTTVAFDKPEN